MQMPQVLDLERGAAPFNDTEWTPPLSIKLGAIPRFIEYHYQVAHFEMTFPSQLPVVGRLPFRGQLDGSIPCFPGYLSEALVAVRIFSTLDLSRISAHRA
jgi:hypothetical protein